MLATTWVPKFFPRQGHDCQKLVGPWRQPDPHCCHYPGSEGRRIPFLEVNLTSGLRLPNKGVKFKGEAYEELNSSCWSIIFLARFDDLDSWLYLRDTFEHDPNLWKKKNEKKHVEGWVLLVFFTTGALLLQHAPPMLQSQAVRSLDAPYLGGFGTCGNKQTWGSERL